MYIHSERTRPTELKSVHECARAQYVTVTSVVVTVEKGQYLDLEKLAAAAFAVD